MAAADVAFGAALGILFGIFFASIGINGFFIIGIGALCGILWGVRRRLARTFLFAFVLSLSLGALYYHFFLNLRALRENIPHGEATEFRGVVRSEPYRTEKTQQFLLSLQSPHAGVIRVVTKLVPEFAYGDFLELRGEIIEEAYSLKPSEEHVALFPDVSLLAHGRGFWLKEKLFALKGGVIETFRRTLPVDSAALLAGLTFGSRSDFSKEFKAQMAASGTSHLVALSGYNITVLVLAAYATLGSFLTRRTTFIATVFVIILFVLMVGGEASVVRAAIMGFLALLAREAGRIYSFRNAVTFAGAGMALADPTLLAWNIGFQLSFVSLLGIVLLLPALQILLKQFGFRAILPSPGRRPESFLGWKENVLTTLAAQLAVAPLLIFHFDQFSPTALLANVLILQLVPLTMALGFMTGAASFIFPGLGIMLAWFAHVLLLYERGVIVIFSHLAFPVRAVPGVAMMLIYYAALIGVIIYARRWKRKNDALTTSAS